MTTKERELLMLLSDCPQWGTPKWRQAVLLAHDIEAEAKEDRHSALVSIVERAARDNGVEIDGPYVDGPGEPQVPTLAKSATVALEEKAREIVGKIGGWSRPQPGHVAMVAAALLRERQETARKCAEIANSVEPWCGYGHMARRAGNAILREFGLKPEGE